MSKDYLQEEINARKEAGEKPFDKPQQSDWEKKWKWIEVRILAEKNKHENMGNNEWAKIAAIKINSEISTQLQKAREEGLNEGLATANKGKAYDVIVKKAKEETLREIKYHKDRPILVSHQRLEEQRTYDWKEGYNKAVKEFEEVIKIIKNKL